MYQLSGQYQAVATIMLNIYQLSRQRLLLCWICNSCQDSSCYSAEYVPLPAVKTAAAIGRYCSRCTSCQYSSWYAAEYVPAVKTAAAILLKMYHLSRQQLIWCWRCTSCQDSICYSAEDIPAVKTAADMLLKMYQLSRQQLPSYWRCTSCQDSSQNRSYFLFCWRAVKTAVPAHKTEAASLLKIYQLSRQKLLFLQKMYQLACSCILRQTKIESLSGQVHFISVKMHSGPTPQLHCSGELATGTYSGDGILPYSTGMMNYSTKKKKACN